MSRHGKYAEDTAKINVVLPAAIKETLSSLTQEDERTLSAYCRRHLVKIAEAGRTETQSPHTPTPADVQALKSAVSKVHDAATRNRKAVSKR